MENTNESNKIAIVALLITFNLGILTLFTENNYNDYGIETGLKIAANVFYIPLVIFIFYLIFLGLYYKNNNNNNNFFKKSYNWCYDRAIELTCVLFVLDFLMLSWINLFNFFTNITFMQLLLSFIITFPFFLELILIFNKIDFFIIISYFITSILFFIFVYILPIPLFFWIALIFSLSISVYNYRFKC